MVRHREDGWVCAEATSAALADGLRYYLTNPAAARHAGDAARSAEQAYHYSRFASEWRDVFGDAGAMSMPAVASHR
jgi:glycosyltransferase involved in cell wall biosynthesis